MRNWLEMVWMGIPKRLLAGLVLIELGLLLAGLQWVLIEHEYPTEWTVEALSAGGWCKVLGKEVTVRDKLKKVDKWCCTRTGNEMTFINFVPFQYGKKQSYTTFNGVSFVTGMYEALKPYEGQEIELRGRIQVYQGTPQIIVWSPDQIKEATDE